MTDSQVCPHAGETALAQEGGDAEPLQTAGPSLPPLRGSADAPAFSLRIAREKTAVLLDCPDPLRDLGATVQKIIEGCQDLELPTYPDQGQLAAMGQAMEFMVNQYRHCKTIFAMGSSAALLPMFGVAATLPSGEADPGVLSDADGQKDAVARFIEAVGQHRHPARESDPPAV